MGSLLCIPHTEHKHKSNTKHNKINNNLTVNEKYEYDRELVLYYSFDSVKQKDETIITHLDKLKKKYNRNEYDIVCFILNETIYINIYQKTIDENY